jgi:CDP-glycerol glycerophosphotransferase
MTLAGGQVHLDGVVTNLFGRLTSESPPTARLVARSRDGRHDVAIGRTTVAVAPDELRWQTVADAAELDLDPSVALWDLGMRIEVDGHVNVSWVTAVPGAVAFRPLPVPDAGVRGTRRLQPQTDAEWHVVVRAEQTERPGGAAARVGRRLHRSVAVRAGRRLLGAVNGRRVKGAVFRHVFTRLPVHPDVVVFESMLGRSYSDSPRYVYEELRRRNRPCRAVWSYSGSRRSWPQDAVLVRRDSWRYYYELARAAVWVDNQGLPDIVTPRAATRYLQTWHGSPLKAMGFDQPELQLGSDATRRRFARLVERWTYFCVQSPFAEEAFQRAFRHRAENLRIGYPRNDPLLAPDRDAAAAAIRARLDLPDDRRLVLYAPTFRDYRRALRAPYSLPFDLAKVGEAVGDRCFFLVRPLYLDRFVVPSRFADVARDVSAHHDMAELLLVADALVTDYSSTMFDYALLRRPMLFYAYDLDLYAMSRGTYFDLETDAPGKVVATEDALIDWLADPVQAHTHFRAAHELFLERFCTYETGHAAAAAVDRLVEEPR